MDNNDDEDDDDDKDDEGLGVGDVADELCDNMRHACRAKKQVPYPCLGH